MRLLFIALLSVGCLCATASDWNTCYENEEVKILFQYSDCHDNNNGVHQQKVILRFINKTTGKIEVSFGRELTYSGTENSLTGDAPPFVVSLNAAEEKQGSCSEKNKALFIFSKQLNTAGRELKKFELKNVTVKTIE